MTPPFHVTSHVTGLATLAGAASDPLYTKKLDIVKQREAAKEVILDNESQHAEHNLNSDYSLVTTGWESRRGSQAGACESVGVIGASYRSRILDNCQYQRTTAGERYSEAGEVNDNEVSEILCVAEDSIRRAESILSSLLGERRENFGQVESDWSLAPGIENNIRQLEETQQTIGDVIDIFRTLLRRQKSRLDLETKRKSSKSGSNQSVNNNSEHVGSAHKVSFTSDTHSDKREDRYTDRQSNKETARQRDTADSTADSQHHSARATKERSSRELRNKNQAAASLSGACSNLTLSYVSEACLQGTMAHQSPSHIIKIAPLFHQPRE